MATAWKVDSVKVDAAREALRALNNELDDLEANYDDHSERWLESDKGQAVRDWLDEAAGLVEDAEAALDDLDELDRP